MSGQIYVRKAWSKQITQVSSGFVEVESVSVCGAFTALTVNCSFMVFELSEPV